jgi:hypothetical protein
MARLPPLPLGPLLAALLTLAGPALTAQELVLIDRIVAVVDEDPILYSDIRQALTFGFVKPGKEESDLRPVLEELIDERLRAHEIDRYGVPPAPEAKLDAQVLRLEESHGGAEVLDAELRRLGSSREELRRWIELQLRILTYVDERLAPRVFVDDDDQLAYYKGELAEQMAKEGLENPPFEEVKDQIRVVLRERRLNEETAQWTADLRQRARLVDLLDRPPGYEKELPPVVLKLEPKPGNLPR